MEETHMSHWEYFWAKVGVCISCKRRLLPMLITIKINMHKDYDDYVTTYSRRCSHCDTNYIIEVL